MATITDNDLKMFQERARTEFASRCDTGGIAWDSVIWDLCNEVRRLRSVSNERGDRAKRNCERFQTKDAAREAFQKLRHHRVLADVSLWDDRDEIESFLDWLFATGKEGGNDGNE